MSGATTTIPLRISAKMLGDIDRYIAEQGGAMTRQDVIVSLVGQALPHAESLFVQPESILELRMPMSEFISVSMPNALGDASKQFAAEHGVSVSAFVRLAVYQALGGAGDAS